MTGKGQHPVEVGPLFAVVEIVENAPEIIWDDNDENPANEDRWLAYHSRHKESMAASETNYIADYKRRRELSSGD